jgi:flagellar motor switch protein FliM
VQIVPPGETVIVVSFQMKLLQSTGLMTICFPYVALEGVIIRLSAQNWIDATKKKSQEKDTAVNRENLLQLAVPMNAVLARTDVTIGEFLNLKIGDIVTTDHRINREVDVYVEAKRKYSGRPGLVGKKRGFVITRIYEHIGKE